jgi:hypothetical protein
MKAVKLINSRWNHHLRTVKARRIPRRRASFVLLIALFFSLLVSPASAASPADRPAASAPAVTVEFDCAAGGWRITSSKGLSNVVYSANGVEERVEFSDDPEVREYLLQAEGAGTIWVKSGNNASGDGPGYGQRFDVTQPSCEVDTDADDDTYPQDVDCNDNDPAINPGATEVANDGIDQDCDGSDLDTDADDDTYPQDVDCNDNDPAINPGATDVPNNGIDENCDGSDLVVGEGDIRVTLLWNSDDDVDLHVIDPSGERIWYRNRASASGGELDRDDNVNSCGFDAEPGGVENVFWAADAPPGSYTVEVYSYLDCAPAGTEFTLQVFRGDTMILEQSGTAAGGTGLDTGPNGVEALETTFTVD